MIMEKYIDLLLVDDDQLDVMDIRRTLNKMSLVFNIDHARNGEDAVQLLSERVNAGAALPDIVLIDINMPKMNGLELLKVIRTTPAWQELKCFILTTSDEQPDEDTARALGISGYIVKPFKLNNFSNMDSFNLMIDLMNMRGTL
jgi:CheY-like chemotaxis protein